MAADEVVEDVYGVFNDPMYFEGRFASGELHPMLRTKLLEEPLFSSALPGPAKRFKNWQDTQRVEDGERIVREGPTVLRHQRITRSAWRDITGQEFDDIDDGRRANG